MACLKPVRSVSVLWSLVFTAHLGEDEVLLKKHYLANNLINFIYIPGNEMLRAYLTITSSE